MEKIDVHGPIREIDEKNFHVAGKKIEVPLAIQDLYWQMDGIRKKLDQSSDYNEKKILLKKTEDLGSIINTVKESANDEVRHFLGMINDELTKLSLRLQMAIRKEEKVKK